MPRKNYARYANIDTARYNSKSVSYYVYRDPADRAILPSIKLIRHKRVLEVGLGTGYYTTYFLENACEVSGVDINPHLGKHLGITIIQATADNFSQYFNDRSFDVVASFWMTEYLSPPELQSFITEAMRVLRDGGLFMTTIIANKGWGRFYAFLSSLKRIQKFTYSHDALHPLFAPRTITIRNLYGKFGFLLGYLVSTQK